MYGRGLRIGGVVRQGWSTIQLRSSVGDTPSLLPGGALGERPRRSGAAVRTRSWSITAYPGPERKGQPSEGFRWSTVARSRNGFAVV